MNKQTPATGDDMDTLAEDACASTAVPANVAGEKVVDPRNLLAAPPEGGKRIYGRAREKALKGAKATHEAVHEHPYHAMGITFAAGALIGYLAARQWSRNGD